MRLRLGLRARARPAVGLVRRVVRRALVVVAPVLREVAVGVDAVAGRDLAVAVVVAQVLAPQAIVVERVLVAVGVRHQDEPQLGALQETLDLLVVGPPAVDEVAQQAPVDLGADPLARVLRRRVEHRRARAVRHLARALRDLQRDQLATLVGPAEHLELDELRVLAREAVQLVADAAGLVPRAPDGEAGGLLEPGLLLHRLPLGVAGQLHADAARAELRDLAAGQHGVRPDPGRGPADAGQLDTGRGGADRLGLALHRVLLKRAAPLTGGRGRARKRERSHGDDRHGARCKRHVLPLLPKVVRRTPAAGSRPAMPVTADGVPCRRGYSWASVPSSDTRARCGAKGGCERLRWRPGRFGGCGPGACPSPSPRRWPTRRPGNTTGVGVLPPSYGWDIPAAVRLASTGQRGRKPARSVVAGRPIPSGFVPGDRRPWRRGDPSLDGRSSPLCLHRVAQT